MKRSGSSYRRYGPAMLLFAGLGLVRRPAFGVGGPHFVRESPSFELIEKLMDLGAKVDFHDPHVKTTHKMRHYDLHMKSIELSRESLQHYDCALIATHHASYDWQMIAGNATLLVDTRNALRDVKGKTDHIVRA